MSLKATPRFQLFLTAFACIFIAEEVFCCATHGKGMSRYSYEKAVAYLAKLNAERNPSPFRLVGFGLPAAEVETAGPMPLLPDANESGGLTPWGGKDRSKWSVDTVIANNASYELNLAWKTAGLISAIVSVPVAMKYTGERPYGDGQTNAATTFGDWGKKFPDVKVPPVVAVRLVYPDKTIIKFRVHKILLANTARIEILYFTADPATPKQYVSHPAIVTLAPDPLVADTWTGEWPEDKAIAWGDAFASHPVWVRPSQPKPFDNWFPIDFRYPVYKKDDLLANARAAGVNTFANGKSVLDPDSISSQGSLGHETPYEKLTENFTDTGKYPEGMNQETYFPPNVHAWLPFDGKIILTAVGEGFTWVYNTKKDNPKGVAPFKNLYTCFEERNSVNEAEGLPAYAKIIMLDHKQDELRAGREIITPTTVPSGGGWHEIGDPAETIINDLENAPIAVGFATGVPYEPTPSGTFAYDLSDVASVAWLKPGEGLVTPAGDQTVREDQSPDKRDRGATGIAGGRNYHWFFFQSKQRVCTQEWVHNCVPRPNNKLGLDCPK